MVWAPQAGIALDIVVVGREEDQDVLVAGREVVGEGPPEQGSDSWNWEESIRCELVDVPVLSNIEDQRCMGR